MIRTRYYIRTLLLLLLLFMGGSSGAWAATKTVTYHVITLPFGGAGHPMAETTNNQEWRIEAIKKTVTQDDTDDIKLPSILKSPLMKYEAYSYYYMGNSGVTKSDLINIFPNNPCQFYTYTIDNTKVLPAGAKVSDLGTDTAYDVYVTYVWDDDHDNLKEEYGKDIDLNGGKNYNIEFTSGNKRWFYALNMNTERGNRPQAVPEGSMNGPEDLASDDIVTIPKTVNGKNKFYFQWRLTNNDPYNIIIKTAHNLDDFIYKEDNYWKKSIGGQLFGSLENSSSTRHNWVTNEVNQAYNSTSAVNAIPMPGYFRGMPKYGRKDDENGELHDLYFSFTLLAHPTANYTLAASWVAVDGHDWVPKKVNNNYQYLLMHHDPEKPPCAGPSFQTLAAADQVRLYEIRDYNYKVETPLSKTILSAHLQLSDYAKDELLINHVPEALKRKYTSITGTYTTDAFNTARTTFSDLYENDEPTVNKPRDIWLKYEVSSSIPFEAGTASTTFEDQKWYNIYVNKEENYITWYDTTDGNKFNTSDGSSGHTKYAHESHFAFIGDPYELLVTNRLASEDASNALRYLQLNSTIANPLTCGSSDTHTYKAVPNGTPLIFGNKYYTTDSSGDQFTDVVAVDGGYYEKKYVGKVATGSNFYEKKDRYVAVASGTLTAGGVYYTSDQGGGIFVSNGTEVSTGTNYYAYDNNYYVAVPDGTRLTVGKTYYTSDTGAGIFVAAYLTADGSNYYEKYDNSDWELIDDDNTGDYAGCFRLRQFKTFEAPVTIGWGESGNRPLNGNGGNGSDITKVARLSVLELPMMTYTYYIVDNSGHVAVKATEEQVTGTTLNYEAIPEVIRSPFLERGTLSFKTYASKEIYDTGIAANYNYLSDSDHKLSSQNITTTNSDEGAANEYKNHIFVFYTAHSDYTSLIDGDEYNVILNNEYLFYDNTGSTETIKSVGDIGENAIKNGYLWALGGGDPYAMTIYVNFRDNNDVIVEKKYVKVENWANGAITFVSTASEASKFIIKSSTVLGAYEVMATTGDGAYVPATGIGADASVINFNMGRVTENGSTVVKMYDNGTYPHGFSQILFQLKKSTATRVTYHLIDMTRKELLTESGRQAAGEKPQIPAEIFSPLVGYENYTYWKAVPYDVNGVATDAVAYTTSEVFYDPVPSDVWITYTANDLVDMNHTTMYLLKFLQGDAFRQENGSDGLLSAVTQEQIAAMTDEEKAAYYKEYQAVYPYCNGDGNFFVYGQKQYELQQEGAASTRTRWAWYIESGNNDPYHVKILSRQTETYDGLERSAYFSTRTFSDYNNGQTVVTALVWPNISGVQSTEYMVLGSVGQYQLVTTYPIAIDKNNDGDTTDEGETERYVVDSFEQYWKTYDTVKKKLLSDLLPLCEERERTDRTDGSLEVPTDPESLRLRLTKKISEGGEYEFHSYQKMANAKRWNGYNASGEKKKGWETREHWFQTVKMGSGYFDLIKTEISPALILLDQHGWEIMRKPLPYSDQDPDKETKKDVLRTWDSPMVKEYIFWASAKKRSGLHQYYLMDKRIGGSTFSSTSLGDLPPWGSENVVDNKGNQYDEYVTYIVKEEYAQSYNPSTEVGVDFLISQGEDIAKKGETDNKLHVGENPGSTSQYIINNISTLKDELWYVKPNSNIDTEMGYGTISHNWGTTNPNAYDSDSPYANLQVAQIITNADDVTKYGRFSFSNGFDPYNIQISSKNGAQYFTLHMTSSKVEEGMMKGDYTGAGGSQTVTLAAKATTTVQGNGYDNSKWAMTNQTFMAVQDMQGNMQLMPRFDHSLRMRDFGTLVTPTAEAGDATKLTETYTYLYRPFVYNYRIIDNSGHESLRYQSAGDLLPQTPDHFKSPLAKDFKYYKNLTYDEGTSTYTEIPAGTDISSKEITASLTGAGLTTPSVTDGNVIYVRYAYDEEADAQHVLLGKWLTMKLNEQDVIYVAGDGIKKSSETKPNPVVGNTDQAWQWKFLKNPYLTPDPYAVQVFNRLASEKDKPMSVGTPVAPATLEGSLVSAQTDGTANYYQRFALLSHSETSGSDVITEGYALAVAGTQSNTDYYFLDGTGLAAETPTAATTAKENDFKGATCSFDAKKSKIMLTDDVENTFTYKIYTNGGVEAISETQSQYEAVDNGFVPMLPDVIQTPLLNDDQFRYYEALTDTAYNSGKNLTNLYGLYDGSIYVRYNAYDPSVSEYKVPNDRNATSEPTVAKGDKSNDAPLRIDGILPHNIIWYDDNMMKADESGIGYTADKELQNNVNYSWTFEGDDPYAIKIRQKSTNQYVHESATTPNTELSETPTTFMLLNRDGYEYGVLAVTGHKEKMLTSHGEQLTTTDTNPTHFIIFSLGTLKVIYHLVMANIGSHEDIPNRERVGDDNYKTTGDDCWNSTDGYYGDDWSPTEPNDTLWIYGTTMRDLSATYQLGDAGGVSYPQLNGSSAITYYCKDVGPISLGDELAVPDVFYRPNVNYFFVVRDIRDNVSTPNAALNQKYKGLEITSKEMSMNEDLIGKIIYIDIVYRFNTDLESNSGDNFVMSIDQNKWYTLETVIGGKTYLAQYTNAWGFELKEGRGSHFTNDFLWTPIGDPYGFQLMNRYMDVNSGDHNLGEKNRAIFSRNFLNNVTGDIHVGGQQILMGDFENNGKLVVVGGDAPIMSYSHETVATNSIYELLEGNNPGYFRFHPVANTSEQTQVFFNPEWADDNGDGTNEYLIRLKSSAAEFTFGLSAELLKPYFDRAGYVGGLTKEAYNMAENAALVAAMKSDNPVLTATQLMQAQDLVYNPENIVQFKTGYYRLHSPLGISGIDPARYVSGYTHAIERDLDGNDNEADAIPMHFYEKNSSEVRQFTDFKDGGFTSTDATRGDITIPPVEKDPASIFYFQKVSEDKDYPKDNENKQILTDEEKARYNLGYVSTQGLYVKGTGEKGVGEKVGERAKAVMTKNALPTDAQHPTSTSPMPLFVMDLGGGVLLIHDNHTANGRSVLKYLSYDYSNDTEGHPTIYDMKLTNHTHTDHAKFCMQPVQDTETKGINEMALKIDLKQDRGDSYYYASFYAPFDVLLTDATNDEAFICKVWDTEILHLKKIGKYNTGTYKDNNQFVPAGTPVIIRSNKSAVTLALPTKEPSAPIPTTTNIFQGKYLEQLLPTSEALDVYTFGFPMTAKSTTKDESTGVITFDQQQKGESDMGFYINATPNRESAADMGSWIRNNRYVYGNKVYYRLSDHSAGARQDTRSPEFIPVVFDDDEDEPIEESLKERPFDNRVYDMHGRCVATGDMVENGTWRHRLAPGIYILNGRKIIVK